MSDLAVVAGEAVRGGFIRRPDNKLNARAQEKLPILEKPEEMGSNKYILFDVLLCSIAEYFYELCRILTRPCYE